MNTRSETGDHLTRVRPYLQGDRGAVHRIAADSAFFGDPIETYLDDRRPFQDVFVGYYTDFEPGYAWVAEVEGRYSFNSNWAMVAFYGQGWTGIDQPEFETAEKIRAFGLGGRWRALKDQGVWVGLDLARGPEDTAYYVQVGHPW